MIDDLLRRDADDSWMRTALLSSSGDCMAELLARRIADSDFRSPGARTALLLLASMVRTAEDLTIANTAVQSIADEEPILAVSLWGELSKHAKRLEMPNWTDTIQTGLRTPLQRVAAIAADSDRTLDRRRQAVAALTSGDWATARPVLQSIVSGAESPTLQQIAVESMTHWDAPEIGTFLLSHWSTMSPTVRLVTIEAMLSRNVWTRQWLAAVEAGNLPRRDMPRSRWQQLAGSSDREIRERASAISAQFAAGSRDAVVKAYRAALDVVGDSQRGRLIFEKQCSACHKIGSIGHELGPNLQSMAQRGGEAILANVLDPNREVNPQYENYLVITEDGRTATGMITAESTNSLTLTRAGGVQETILRDEILELRSTGQSLMPEGIEETISIEAMADLLTFLKNP